MGYAPLSSQYSLPYLLGKLFNPQFDVYCHPSFGSSRSFCLRQVRDTKPMPLVHKQYALFVLPLCVCAWFLNPLVSSIPHPDPALLQFCSSSNTLPGKLHPPPPPSIGENQCHGTKIEIRILYEGRRRCRRFAARYQHPPSDSLSSIFPKAYLPFPRF